MNQALYRRYRPENFGEVIGQEHVTEPLMQALRTDRVSHAYLFSGPRGCGKTTCARILARCLNCAQGPTPVPCGECASCQELGRGGSGSLDVVEIDAASHGGVDDTRDLREKAVFAPARDRYKIFVLDEAHMVSREGFNALLKIVEEPPPHVKFIFATTEPNKVLPTIRSRSHHYPFRLVPPGLMTSYMEELSRAEEVEVAPGVMQMVVRAGGGSVRDTESVLDQLIGGSTDGRVTYEGAAALLGFTPDELISQMVGALDRGDGASVFAVVESVVESGLEPQRFAEDLLERLRDLIVLAAAGPAARQALRGLPEDRIAALAEQAGQFGLARLTRAADAVSAGLAAMAGATSPRLHLELLAARTLMLAQVTAPAGQVSSPAPDAASAGRAPRPASSPPAQGAPPVDRVSARPPGQSRPATGSAGGWTIPGVTTGASEARSAPGKASAGSAPGAGAPGAAAPGAGAPGGAATDAPPRGSAAPPRGAAGGPASAGRAGQSRPAAGPGAPGPRSAAGAAREFVDWDEPDGSGPGGTPPARPQPGAGPAGSRPNDQQSPPRGPARPPQARPQGGPDSPDQSGQSAEAPRRVGAGDQSRPAARRSVEPSPEGSDRPAERPTASGTGARPGPGDRLGAAPAPDGVAKHWPRLLEHIRQVSVSAHGLLAHDAQLVGAEPGHLTLAFPSPDLVRTFERRFVGAVEQAAANMVGHPVKVSAVVAAVAAPNPPPAPADRPGSPAARTSAPADPRPAPADPPPAPTAPPPAPADRPGSPAARTPAPAGPADKSGTPAGRTSGHEGAAASEQANVAERRSASGPPASQGPAPGRAASPAPPARRPPPAPEFEDEASPEDADAGVRGLTGVPLVVEMLGGEVIEEIDGT
ncbi:MAG: DNA polymerase III subunit gamma and tau [Bifidobacteriaceae bacterium]|nr:DNA polymerase III subunit gamma and tau [Bifidobacteriaceae bacterium]